MTSVGVLAEGECRDEGHYCSSMALWTCQKNISFQSFCSRGRVHFGRKERCAFHVKGLVGHVDEKRVDGIL